ncbi:neurotransmitter:Na+ symporter, NSS family [Marinobacter daqiaonensis]|uniref:Neurotransmitter:Na+ symporter, NSS family n=1 Tax=Marinobacter daqiaonensis TaxID=650891 RepID=A0A1I6HYC7_9GAMM|nr:sodium-dependent transporter [Marinobacter daqiaonensis]SFR59220.1 neurotransmitter:Na+ symporter, NSS family [Marinobacter daqiaonensis]
MSVLPNATLGLWANRSTFFWAATAATIGLGNLWQFPWLANQFGGGYFVLLYLGSLLLVTLPLMLAETALGRHSRHSMVLAMAAEAAAIRQSPRWRWVGRLSILAGFLVLSMTLVIGSICLAYVFYGALGHFDNASTAAMTHLLSQLVEDTHEYRGFMAWHLFFIILVGAVAIRGNVVERAFRLVMPIILLVLAGLLWWVFREGRGAQALASVTALRAEDVSLQSVWLALSHAFYTLGLGLGVWAVFGAMMAPGTPLKRSVIAVTLMDTLVGVCAGAVIYGLASTAIGASSAQGFGLVFVALPVGLGEQPGHQFMATALFTVITLVAWTSALALSESVVGWLREWVVAPRWASVLLVLVSAWLVGLVTLFSFNIWSSVELAGLTPFRWIELVTSGLLIPAVTVALAIFLGWRGPPGYLVRLLGDAPEWLVMLWHLILRYLLPLVVAAVGLSYSVVSLQLLCQNGDLGWCAPSAHEVGAQGMTGSERSPGPNSRPGPGKAAEY